MIEFWIAAGVLLLISLAFVLLPAWRGRQQQTEEDRTALNVALYQERIAELERQESEGELSAEQLAAARDEATRELLDDTAVRPAREGRLGRAVPVVLGALVPVFALGLYLHWGASDKLAVSYMLQTPATSNEDMMDRLQQVVKVQPESTEAWYLLGRAYMAQEKPALAAHAFEQTVKHAGRDPELLAQWAQAQYFATNKQWTPALQALTEESLKGNPSDVTALGLMGIVSFEAQDYNNAIQYWSRLVAQLPEGDPSREAIEGGIQRARGLGGIAEATQEAPAQAAAEITVQVALAPELAGKVKADDSVFVFARAEQGPPMPLAVKRLTVADLPVTLTLSDTDAMVAGMNLSSFPKVVVMARVSRAGAPTQGEWVSELFPVAVSKGAKANVELLIDQAEAPQAQ